MFYQKSSKSNVKSDAQYKNELEIFKRVAKESRRELLMGSMTLDYVGVISLKKKIEECDVEISHIERVLQKRALK